MDYTNADNMNEIYFLKIPLIIRINPRVPIATNIYGEAVTNPGNCSEIKFFIDSSVNPK